MIFPVIKFVSVTHEYLTILEWIIFRQ